MLTASAAFMTPFGYQTNLMVMGPGGYATKDFLIFGTPMQIFCCLRQQLPWYRHSGQARCRPWQYSVWCLLIAFLVIVGV